jgi:lipopolysaccharide biosynthesis glycosyltransferase
MVLAKRTLIYFVADANYLQVTLVVAFQAAQSLGGRDDVDIVIYTHDIADDLFTQISAYAAPRGVRLVSYHSTIQNHVARLDFGKQHLSPTALGRLEVATAIPDHYDKIIYLDGDMQVLGDIGPLIDLTPPEGSLLGCVDSTYVCAVPSGELARNAQPYLESIGVADRAHYYNSGLVYARRADWQRIAQAALTFILDHGDLCRYHDQSAINAVARGAYLPIHPRYNYGPIYEDVHAPFRPVIYHFMGPHKPWAPSAPFGPALAEPYLRLKAELPCLPVTRATPALRPKLNVWSLPEIARHAARHWQLRKYLRNERFFDMTATSVKRAA